MEAVFPNDFYVQELPMGLQAAMDKPTHVGTARLAVCYVPHSRNNGALSLELLMGYPGLGRSAGLASPPGCCENVGNHSLMMSEGHTGTVWGRTACEQPSLCLCTLLLLPALTACLGRVCQCSICSVCHCCRASLPHNEKHVQSCLQVPLFKGAVSFL